VFTKFMTADSKLTAQICTHK